MLARLTDKWLRLIGDRPPSYSLAKELLVDHAFTRVHPAATSMADLGGVHLVDGAYAFHAFEKYELERAVLVDLLITKAVRQRAARLPGFVALEGSFDCDEVLAEIGHVDVVLMFDVLLHQVAPDWREILALYAARTDCLVIHNPQWTAGHESVRLLDLGIDAYFDNVPHRRTEWPYRELAARLDERHPEIDRPWRDLRRFWQWGITDRDLVDACRRLGFELKFRRSFGRFGDLENFCNCGLIFGRDQRAT